LRTTPCSFFTSSGGKVELATMSAIASNAVAKLEAAVVAWYTVRSLLVYALLSPPPPRMS
jgi:hypothetical protein